MGMKRLHIDEKRVKMLIQFLVLLFACGEEKDTDSKYKNSPCENHYEAQHDCYVALGQKSSDEEYKPAGAEISCQSSTCPTAFYDCLIDVYVQCSASADDGALQDLFTCENQKDPPDCQQ